MRVIQSLLREPTRSVVGIERSGDAEDLEEMYNEYPAMKGKVASMEKKMGKMEQQVEEANAKSGECDSKK